MSSYYNVVSMSGGFKDRGVGSDCQGGSFIYMYITEIGRYGKVTKLQKFVTKEPPSSWRRKLRGQKATLRLLFRPNSQLWTMTRVFFQE